MHQHSVTLLRSRYRKTWLLAAIVGALASPQLRAQVLTCSVTASPVSFGTYDPTSPSNLPSTGLVTVSCLHLLGNTPVTIALDGGGSGVVTARVLRSGTNTLNYNLYQDAAYSRLWGTSGSQLVTVTLTLLQLTASSTIYAMIPAGQNPAAGSYTDTITVTINY